MPGQEKMVLDYYQKNPSATQSLKGALYEEKILTLFKSKIKLKKKNITTIEAEKLISDFNKSSQNPFTHNHEEHNHDNETKDNKEKKSSKTPSIIKKKTKKVSKK